MKIKSDRLEEHEVNAMLAQCDRRSKMGLRDYLVMRTLFETGIRKSELCSLKVNSIKSHSGGYRVWVKTLKKRKESYRELEITPELYNALQRNLNGTANNPEAPLLHTLGGPWWAY